MSKSKEVATPATKAETRKAYWSAVVKARAKRAGIVAVLLTVMLLLSHGVAHVVVAALYIFANDGKVSGRMSGDVKMRNGRQRAWAFPSLVRNIYTSIVRSLLSQLSAQWNSLTDTQRSTWINASGNFKTDRFGNPVEIKGKTLYVQRNANLVNVLQSPVDSYPGQEEVPGIVDIDVAGSTFTVVANVITAFDVAFTPTPTSANVAHKIFATAPLSAGTSRPKSSAFRGLGVIPAGSASTFDILAMYTAKFGNSLPTGGVIFVTFQAVNIDTGQMARSRPVSKFK